MLRPLLAKAGLSNRESEVAALVATGLSNKEVADRLFVTEKTIKFHLTNIYKKMNIRSRAQLIVWCLPHIRFEEVAATGTDSVGVSQPANSVNPQSSVAGGIQQEVVRQDSIANEANANPIGTTLTPGRYNPGSDIDMGGGAFGAR